MSILSVLIDKNLNYPAAGDCFSPDEFFPEYQFGHISARPNSIYRAVRKLFIDSGLDKEAFGTNQWNPLGDIVKEGSSVFVLCNFVYHQRPFENHNDFLAKCTHASVIRPVIDYLLRAIGRAGAVFFGNAPVQSCIWNQVTRQTGAQTLVDFYSSNGMPVTCSDLRIYREKRNVLGRVIRSSLEKEVQETISIPLFEESFLASLPLVSQERLRVNQYNPDWTAAFHKNRKHVYILNKRILDADIIFSIPKLKTHEKVGITCALKGCVGAIGRKDCLAHYRTGMPSKGGDEYPGDFLGILQLLGRLHDITYRTRENTLKGNILRMFHTNLERITRRFGISGSGAWHGNDTCWRMALDIAQIISRYQNGILTERPSRRHYAIIDGILAGEGQGPLKPRARHTGALIFADNPVRSDYVAAQLMGFKPETLPIVSEALRHLNYFSADLFPSTAILNGVEVPLSQLANLEKPFAMPAGW